MSGLCFSKRHRWPTAGWLLAVAAWFGAGFYEMSATTPVISFIQAFSTNQVLIHFDTDGNRTYTVQFTDSLTPTGGAPIIWSNLYTTPLLPFPDHYIVPDTRTTPQRFYRLQVTP